MSDYRTIENQIEEIFSSIKTTDSFENAERFFSALEPLQFELAKVLFKDHADLTERLKKFVSEFDRIDDIALRKSMFIKIKNGESSF